MIAPRSLIFCGFLLIVVGAPASAQEARLNVCNTGRVPVEVAVATSDSRFLVPNSDYWIIKAYTVAPDHCSLVYDEAGRNTNYCSSLPANQQIDCDNPPGEAVVGFGFRAAAERLLSLQATPLPDLGMYWRSSRKILSRDSRSLCVDPLTARQYVTTDGKLPGACVSGWVALKASYDFYPNGSVCGSSSPGVGARCGGGDYVLNIAADPTRREVDVVAAADSNRSQETAADTAVQDAFKQALRDAVEQAKIDEAKRKEAADPMNQAAANRKIYEARANSIDYAAEHTRNIGRVRDLSEFTPDWLRTTEPMLYVRGTVSRVEPPSGPRQPARLYFKESPDDSFIACIPTPQIFNLQQYVGKHLEVRGRISQSNCGGKVADVQIANPAMILDLAKGTPADEAVLPGMNAASSGNAPRAMAAIPIGTRIRVSLTSNVDLQHAANGATFQGQLAAPITLPDGLIPQGAAVVLIHDAYSRLGISSVAADGKVWRVSGKIDASSDVRANGDVLRAGTTLVFAVAGTDAPVVIGR